MLASDAEVEQWCLDELRRLRPETQKYWTFIRRVADAKSVPETKAAYRDLVYRAVASLVKRKVAIRDQRHGTIRISEAHV